MVNTMKRRNSNNSNWRLVGSHDYRYRNRVAHTIKSLFFTSAPSGISWCAKQSPEAEWNTDEGLGQQTNAQVCQHMEHDSHSLRVHRSISDGPQICSTLCTTQDGATEECRHKRQTQILCHSSTADWSDTGSLYLPAPSSIDSSHSTSEWGIPF